MESIFRFDVNVTLGQLRQDHFNRSLDGSQVFGDDFLRTPAQFAAAGIFYALVHSLLEEYYWRWFVFGQLRRLLPLGQSTALASLAFAAHHWIVLGSYFGRFSPVTWLMTFAVAVGGAVWCGIYHRSHSLLGPWLSHALVDAAIFAVGFAIIRHAAGG